MTHRSGFVAVIGRPNVGKSTLVNALVGQKISIVTTRPHTTRHAIVGVMNAPDSQVVFIDTPGLDPGSGRLINKAMNKAAVSAVASADLIVLVVEAGTWKTSDQRALETAERSGVPFLLVVNKIDRIKPKDRLLPMLAELAGRADFASIVPVAALNSTNLDRLAVALREQLPEQEALYSPDMVTTRDVSFRAAEVLREKLMQALRQELPYGLGVEISQLEEDERGRLIIDATVWVDRDSHKGMVVGRGGQLIKKVGQAAREELQDMLDCRVHLQSHVKVKKNWSDNAQALRELGYDGEL